MKFLVDENLPPALARRLVELGHDAVHVADVNLIGAPDERIARYAQDANCVIVTRDADFNALARVAPSLKVMRVAVGNASNANLLLWIVPRLDEAILRIEGGVNLIDVT